METTIRESLWEKETLEISTRQIKNVLYVNGLKHNFLSISQLYDKGFKIEFNKSLLTQIMEPTQKAKIEKVSNLKLKES